MLSARGVGIPDRAVGAYVHPGHAAMARTVAQVAVCDGLGDRVAWQYLAEAAAAERGRNSALECFRIIHGEKGRGRGQQERR